MPALDTFISGGVIHISDRNKAKPVKTLCGQALDKPTIRYLELAENFDRADCKVCRSSYFEEAWNGEVRTETDSSNVVEEPETSNLNEVARFQAEQMDQPRRALFGNLSVPVNEHKQEQSE